MIVAGAVLCGLCVWELIFSLFHFACVGWGGWVGVGHVNVHLQLPMLCEAWIGGCKEFLVGAGEENHPPEEDVKIMRCECWQCRQSMVCLPVVVKSLVLVVVHSRVLSWFGNLVLVVVKTYSRMSQTIIPIYPYHIPIKQ